MKDNRLTPARSCWLLQLFILLLYAKQATQFEKYSIFKVLSDTEISDEDRAVHLAAEFINHLRSELKHGEMYRHDMSEMPIPAHMTSVLADVSLKAKSRKILEDMYLKKDPKGDWMCNGRYQTTLVKPYHTDFEDYHVKNFIIDLAEFAQHDQNPHKTELYADFIERARNIIVTLKADWQESLEATEKTSLLDNYEVKEDTDTNKMNKIHEILGTDRSLHKYGYDARKGQIAKLQQDLVDKQAIIDQLNSELQKHAMVDKDEEIKKLKQAIEEMEKAKAATSILERKYPNYRRRRSKARRPFKRQPYIRATPLTSEEFQAKREKYREAILKRDGKITLPAEFTPAHRTTPPDKADPKKYGFSAEFPPKPNPEPNSVLSFDEWLRKNKINELTFDEFAKQQTAGGRLNNRKRHFGSKAVSWEDIRVGQEYDTKKRKKREAAEGSRDLAHKIYRSEISKKFKEDFQQMWLLSPETTRMWCSYHVCRTQCAISGQTKCDDEDEQVRQVHIACAINSNMPDFNEPLYTIAESGKESCIEGGCTGTSTIEADKFHCDETTLLCSEEQYELV